jgi:hypothetical protein
LWKHFDRDNNNNAARRSRELVLSWIATVGNYDYGFNWVFHQDGTLEMQVLLTGIMETKGVDLASASHHPDRETAYGHLVDRNLLAVHHQRRLAGERSAVCRRQDGHLHVLGDRDAPDRGGRALPAVAAAALRQPLVDAGAVERVAAQRDERLREAPPYQPKAIAARALMDDVIRRAKDATAFPMAAYHVSGEYAMVKAAVQNGWLDERRTVLEILTSIRRAGADLVLTYHAKDAADWISQG